MPTRMKPLSQDAKPLSDADWDWDPGPEMKISEDQSPAPAPFNPAKWKPVYAFLDSHPTRVWYEKKIPDYRQAESLRVALWRHYRRNPRPDGLILKSTYKRQADGSYILRICLSDPIHENPTEQVESIP